MRTTLRADALLDLVLGALLLLAPFDALYDALDLPRAEPAFWAQLAGGMLIAFAYLLWISPRDVRLTNAVAMAAAVANAGGVLLIAVWLLNGGLDVGGLGTTLLVLVAAALVVFAVLEGRIAARSVAGLLPPD